MARNQAIFCKARTAQFIHVTVFTTPVAVGRLRPSWALPFVFAVPGS
jgi:hypothetical protein